MSRLPLEGVRVVDLCVIYSGPFASWLLAALGAEVIHVDSIHHQPDMARFFTGWLPREVLEGRDGHMFPNKEEGERPWNRKAFFNRVGWNKLSCCINLSDPRGKEVFKNLIRVSDIFIENNSALAMDHLGLGPEALLEANPRLVSINMPSYGRTGPYRDYVGFGDNAEAVCGHSHVRGYDDEDHPLHNTPMYHMDSSAGAMAAFAAIMGLRRRKKTGLGTAVDFAQVESFIPQMGEIYMDWAWNHRNLRTTGNRGPGLIQGCYRCRGEDAWVNVTVRNEQDWQGLLGVLGNPAWAGEERFSCHESRIRHHDEIDALIEDWTKARDKFEAFQILQAAGVPAGPVLDERETYQDPQLTARGFFQVIHQEDTGTHRYPGFLWKMSETPPTFRHPPCRLGEHNRYVFEEVLGMSPEEIQTLEKDQVIGGDRYLWAPPRPGNEET